MRFSVLIEIYCGFAVLGKFLCGLRSAECGKCGVWKMRSVENEECGK